MSCATEMPKTAAGTGAPDTPMVKAAAGAAARAAAEVTAGAAVKAAAGDDMRGGCGKQTFSHSLQKQPQGRKSFKSFGGTQRGRGMAHSPAEKEICAGLNR